MERGRHDRATIALGLAMFLVILYAVAWYVVGRDRFWFPPLASLEGGEIDRRHWITLWSVTVGFVVVHAILGYALLRFRSGVPGRAAYLPDHRGLEALYTAVPAVVFIGLSVGGILLWERLWRPAPPDALVVEVRAEQFAWSARYPGPDGKLGRVDPRIPRPFNVDPDDPASRDDFTSPEVVLVVNRSARILLRSKDVIHSFFVPHFRLKLDAVPGRTDELLLTPTRLGTYDFACAELCGVGHYIMRGRVRVVTQEEFDAWAAQQTRAQQGR
ncbi:MAG: cytochrome c oxidase subunit II [bacterium]